MSGGEKNLLGIVKSLMMDKEVILLDEPFSALDVQSKRLLQKKIYQCTDKTMLVITHDISRECLNYFDEILIMQDRRLILSGETSQVMASNEYQALLND